MLSKLLKREYRIETFAEGRYGYPLYSPQYRTGFLFLWSSWKDVYKEQFQKEIAQSIIITRKMFDKARGYRVS